MIQKIPKKICVYNNASRHLSVTYTHFILSLNNLESRFFWNLEKFFARYQYLIWIRFDKILDTIARGIVGIPGSKRYFVAFSFDV